MPYWSSISTAVLAISCSWLAEMILPIELSGPGVWPRDRAVMVRKRVNFSPSDCTYQSAIRSRKAWSLIAGPVGPVRSRANFMTSR